MQAANGPGAGQASRPMPALAGGEPCRTVLFSRARSGFDEVGPAWSGLAARTRQLRFFQHPDWYRALFDAGLADPDEFVFVTCRDRGQDVAVLPLHLRTQPLMGWPVRSLGLFEHPHITLAGGLFGDGQDGTHWLPEVAQALHGHAGLPWDMLQLNRVPERATALGAAAAGQDDPASAGHDVSPQGLSAYVDTQDEAAAFEPVSNSFKRELRRRTRKAEETAPLQYQVHADPAGLGAALDRVLALEASGWKGAAGQGTAIMLDPALRSFYHALAQRFGQRGECFVALLRHGEADVAGQVGLRVNGTVNLLKIAYHEAHSCIAPGNLIMERTIRWCCTQPDVREMSFVTNPPWAHLWKPRHERVSGHRVFNHSLRGRLLQWGLRAKRWNDRRREAQQTVAAVPGQAGSEDLVAG
jgi:CelD/BcsL family acetyltransferase involved in cellulose biosynthesis